MREDLKKKITQFLNEVGFTKHLRGKEEWSNEELAQGMAQNMFLQIHEENK